MESSNDGAWLRLVQNEIKAVGHLPSRLVAIYDELDIFLAQSSYGDQFDGWAKGLQGDVTAALYDLGYFDAHEGPTRGVS